jgi:hypothetical protein
MSLITPDLSTIFGAADLRSMPIPDPGTLQLARRQRCDGNPAIDPVPVIGD